MDPDDFWALAGEHCTDRELEALRIRASGATHSEGGDQLGITKQAFHRRIRRATARIRDRKQPRGGAHAA